MLKYAKDYNLKRDASTGFAMFIYISSGIVNAAIFVFLTMVATLSIHEIINRN